jgi:hypothetical protein
VGAQERIEPFAFIGHGVILGVPPVGPAPSLGGATHPRTMPR